MIRRKEAIKTRAEINEIKDRKKMEKIDETKNWFFEKIKKLVRKRLGRQKLPILRINRGYH